ncbi:MAG TPA: NADPH-dependent oxidoreductase [Polyangiaceae bacterium]|nr:NADPH-dependent oxidoreductase [Polyangiaceae bacterium]
MTTAHEFAPGLESLRRRADEDQASAAGLRQAPEQLPHIRDLLRLRYGDGWSHPIPMAEPPSSGAQVVEGVVSGLLSHRSVRQYLPKALPAGTLELLVAAAQSAASSSNLQLWSVIAVEDAERRRALAQVANNQAHIQQAPLFLVWIADLNRAAELARARGLSSEGLSYLEMFLMASIDTALAAQNAVVAAEALGLGTVYIGALRNHPERVAEVLGVPSAAYAVFGLCVGWPNPDAPAAIKPRLPQRVVLHREKYRLSEPEHAAVAGYDRVMQAFYGEQGMPVPAGGWSLHSAKRVANAAALNGRHVLRDVLERLGFALK